MITISFIRHGESTDNLKAVWAGWRDSPLSNHGKRQADACGAAFSTIRFAAIYSSPLQRTLMTAQAVLAAQDEPLPPLIISQDLREQHFGIAEGQPWVLDQTVLDVERKIFPVLAGRDAKFPGAESLNDLEVRANRVLDELILPWVWDPEKGYGKVDGDVHLAVVSHGLCISEIISALVKRDADGHGSGVEYRGLVNTGWTRVTVGVKDEDTIPAPTTIDGTTSLVVRVTHFNHHEHLVDITRQKGGIGSMAYDPAQKDIREFFGGGAPKV